jgi:hypothetical protein
MPSNNRASYKQANIDKRASMNHANPKTENPATLRQSQQVSEIAGKHPNPPILLRLEKAFYNFKESPKATMGRKPESPILINARKHDCQPASANANPSRLDPATQRHTRHTIRPHDPAHYIQRHAHRLTARHWYYIAQRTGRAARTRARNLFYIGRADGVTPLPRTAQRDSFQCVNPSPQKNSLFTLSTESCNHPLDFCSYRYR